MMMITKRPPVSVINMDLVRQLSQRGIRIDNVDLVNTVTDLKGKALLEISAQFLQLSGFDVSVSQVQHAQSISAKYKMAEDIVADLDKMGFDSVAPDIFFYGSQVEIERLLSFIVDQLPSTKDDSDGDWNDEDPLDLTNLTSIDPILINLIPKESRNAAFNLITQDKVNEDKVDKSDVELIQRLKLCQNEYKKTRIYGLAVKDDLKALMEREKRLQEQLLDAKVELNRTKKVATLISDQEKSIEELETLIVKSKAKCETMNVQWIDAQQELNLEFQELQHQLEAKMATKSPATQEKATLTRAISDLRVRIASEESRIEFLTKMKMKLVPGESRQTLRAKVMGIMESIDKQRLERDRVIEDTKSSQREVNRMEGMLARSLQEAQAELSKVAESEAELARGPDLLMRLDQAYTRAIEAERLEGKRRRHLREVSDQVEDQRLRSWDEKLAQLQSDLDRLKKENDDLLLA